ncbi:MAG: C40 family peptidase [Hyphomicrobiaceae bacterium]|nr:C40 family peptidase [Hyphomicrobiaceae bacterium]
MTPPTALPDPRRNAYRRDLADSALVGVVTAARFADGSPGQIIRASVPLRRNPSPVEPFDTEVLFGERVRVFDVVEGWAWVQLERDRYVGYLSADAVSREVRATTHKVRAIGTFVHPRPDIKSPPMMHLSIGAELCIAETGEQFHRLESGGFVPARHVVEADRHARDFVDIAERLIGTPYLWGGRTRVGIDCSGLVQVSLEAAGLVAPRDSDMQRAELGDEIEIGPELEGLERGDLVFWQGHVGMMADGLMLLHANAHHMAVAIETLPEAVARISKTTGPILAVRRLAGRATA